MKSICRTYVLAAGAGLIGLIVGPATALTAASSQRWQLDSFREGGLPALRAVTLDFD